MASPECVLMTSVVLLTIDSWFRSPVAFPAAVLMIFIISQVHYFNFITTAWLHPFI